MKGKREFSYRFEFHAKDFWMLSQPPAKYYLMYDNGDK